MGLGNSSEVQEPTGHYRTTLSLELMRQMREQDEIIRRREQQEMRFKQEILLQATERENIWQVREPHVMMYSREEERIRHMRELDRTLQRRRREALWDMRKQQGNMMHRRGDEGIEQRYEQDRFTQIKKQQENLDLMLSNILVQLQLGQEEHKPNQNDLQKKNESERRVSAHDFRQRLTQHKVNRNFKLIDDLRRAFGLPRIMEFPKTPYTELHLPKQSSEFNKVFKLFKKTNSPNFTVTKIVKVDNLFLLLHYKLAMKKYIENEDCDYMEETLFHGTKREFLDGICSFNFDRRKVKTHKFGWGVSFATNSFYATHYHRDNKRRMQKVMVLAKVFIEDVELGSPETDVPEEPCYTTTNKDASVLVKYDDASFYPLYIVYYRGLHYRQKRFG